MPIDQPTADALTGILQRFRTLCDDLANLLPNVGPQIGPSRIEVLQKNYAEVSNYDRHYSATRSALTTLLVTVGLLIVVDPLKSLSSVRTCGVTSVWDGFADLFSQFSITLLLFFITFPLNFYFRRITLACGVIERAIEREIGRSPALPDTTNITLPAYLASLEPPGPVGYYFRYDLYRIAKKIRWPRADAMTILLVYSVLQFISILFILKFTNCGFWPSYLTYCSIFIPFIVSVVIIIWNRLHSAPEQVIG